MRKITLIGGPCSGITLDKDCPFVYGTTIVHPAGNESPGPHVYTRPTTDEMTAIYDYTPSHTQGRVLVAHLKNPTTFTPDNTRPLF